VVITCLLAPKVLGLFGADYAQYSTLLILLLVGTIPNTLTDLAMASLRVQRRLVAVAAITVTGSSMTTGGAFLLWLLIPQWGITGAGVSALASSVIIATTLAVLLFYRYRVNTRTAGTAGDSSACVDDEPPLVVAPLAEVSLLSPVVAFGPPADESPPENTVRSGRL
jgi:O-antigen/teichoic acid export membrane protein